MLLLPTALSALAAAAALGLAAAGPSIYLSSPAEGARLVRQPLDQALQVPLSHQLFGAPGPGWQVCVELRCISNDQLYLQPTCLPASSESKTHTISIQRAEVGAYEVIARIQPPQGSNIEEDRGLVRNRFEVLSYEDAAPALALADEHLRGSSVGQSQLALVADPTSGTAALSVDYDLQSRGLDVRGFTTCVQLLNSLTGQAVLPLTCVAPTDRHLDLKNLQPGRYRLTLLLQDQRRLAPEELRDCNQALAVSAVTRSLEVLALVQAWPALELAHDRLEYALDPHTHAASATVRYTLRGLTTAMPLVKVCIELRGLLPKTCLAHTNTAFTLTNLPAGVYHASLSIESLRDDAFGPTRVVEIEAREEEEFRPSYQWQRLRVWHTIPSGLETRLPIGGTAIKEARIPSPWRLQLTMPAPCKYFLRMNVSPSTTAQEIVDAARNLCHDHDFSLVVEDQRADPSLTAAQLDLFNAAKHLALVGVSP